MKKIMLTATAFIVTVSLFAQTSSPPQPASKDTKGKTSAAPNQIAVSDPGTPSKRTAAPAPASSAPSKEATKGKHKGKGHHKK